MGGHLPGPDPGESRDDDARREPITWDINGLEAFPAFALSESAHDEGLLWAGTTDGGVHLSRDRAGSWTDVTPEVLLVPTTVNRIDTSPHAAGRVCVAAYRYWRDDYRP